MSNIDPYQTPDVPPSNAAFARPNWPQQPVPYHPQVINGLAIASLVLGILWLGWLGSTLAIVFGHVALKQIGRKSETGKGLAIAGLVLGYVGAGTFVLFVLLPLLAAAGA